VIASILAPVAVVSTWAQRELTSTEYFVNTFLGVVRSAKGCRERLSRRTSANDFSERLR